MLGLEIPGKGFLELGDAAFNFTLMNPIFTASGIKKAFSFPVSVKGTPANNKYLNYANRLDVSTKVKVDCIVHLGGSPFLYGYLTVDSSSNETYDLTFTDYTTDFIEAAQIRKIKDVMDETITIVSTRANFRFQLKNAPATIPQNSKIGIRINGIVYSHTVEVPAGESQQVVIQALVDLINADFPNSANVYITSDTFTLLQPVDADSFAVLAEDFTAWHFYEWDIEVANYQHTIHLTEWETYLLSIENTTLQNLKVAFPVLKNGKFYESNRAFFNRINDYSNEYLLNDTAHESGQWKRVIIPYVSLRYLIEECIEYLGYTIDATLLEKLFLCHSKSIDLEITGLSDTEFYNIFERAFNLKDFIPDLLIHNVLQAISQSLFVVFFEQNGQFTTTSIVDIIKQNAEDWTAKATESYKNQTLAKGVSIDMQEDSKDDASTYSSVTIDDGEIDYTLIATVYENGQVEVPIDSDFGLKLLKYEHDGGYPECSNYTTPTDTATEQEYWLNMLSKGKSITKIFRLTTADLRNIAGFENPVKSIQHKNGFIKGVIKSVTFKANNQGISESTVEMLCF